METITEHKEGAYFPQTSTTYRCTNTSCQEEIDKQTEKRLKQRTERQEETKRRTEKKLIEKQAKYLEKLQ